MCPVTAQSGSAATLPVLDSVPPSDLTPPHELERLDTTSGLRIRERHKRKPAVGVQSLRSDGCLPGSEGARQLVLPLEIANGGMTMIGTAIWRPAMLSIAGLALTAAAAGRGSGRGDNGATTGTSSAAGGDLAAVEKKLTAFMNTDSPNWAGPKRGGRD